MKRNFRIDLTELAGDDETRRVTETLMASASGKIANQDADRFVAAGDGQDDGKVEAGDRRRFVAVGAPDDGKVETGRYIAVSVGDDKIENALRDGPSGSARVGRDKFVAIGEGDDKIFG